MSIELLEQAQTSSGSSVEESDDIVRYVVQDGTEEAEALFEIEQGKAQSDEGDRMLKTGKDKLSRRAQLILQEYNGQAKDIPKQFAFVGDDYTAWINTRPNGYGKLTEGMVNDLAKIDPSVKEHIKVSTSISVKWGSIPDDKQGEVATYLYGLNKIVYGEDWTPSKQLPSLVEVKKDTKAKTDSFYSNQFKMAADAMKKFQELLPIPFSISSKNGRKK